MTDLPGDSNKPLPGMILLWLRRLLDHGEKTREEVRRTGDDVRDLHVLLDLHRHPDHMMQRLGETLEDTLEQINRSAGLMTDGLSEIRHNMDTLLERADRNTTGIAELQTELRDLRQEHRRLRYDLGLDPGPDNA